MAQILLPEMATMSGLGMIAGVLVTLDVVMLVVLVGIVFVIVVPDNSSWSCHHDGTPGAYPKS